MSDQTKDCEACFGTGNEPRGQSPYPIRKILFRPAVQARCRSSRHSV